MKEYLYQLHSSGMSRQSFYTKGCHINREKILAQLSHIVLVPYFDEVDKGRVLANFYLGVKEKVGTYFSLDSGTFELRGKPHISLASY